MPAAGYLNSAGTGFGNTGPGGPASGYGWGPEPSASGGAARFETRFAFGGDASHSTPTQAAPVTFLAMSQFTQALLDPAVDGRGMSPAGLDAELSAFAAMGNEPTHGGIGRDAYAARYGRPSLAAPNWSVWATGYGGSQVSTDGSGSAGRSFGTVAGADYALSAQTRIGFALAGGGTGFANNMSSGRSDLFQAGAFVRHDLGSGYVATALTYGWQAIRSDHRVTPAGSGQLDPAINANAYSGRLEGGYRLATRWLGITPYAAAQVITFRPLSSAAQSAFAPDAPSAALGSDTLTDSRVELGLRTNGSIALWGSMVNLRGRFAWAHDFSAGQTVPTALPSLPGQSLIGGGTALAPNAALTGVAIELRNVSGWSAVANFDSELSSLIRSYTGKAVLHYAW